jgi:hypothetical protein
MASWTRISLFDLARCSRRNVGSIISMTWNDFAFGRRGAKGKNGVAAMKLRQRCQEQMRD